MKRHFHPKEVLIFSTLKMFCILSNYTQNTLSEWFGMHCKSLKLSFYDMTHPYFAILCHFRWITTRQRSWYRKGETSDPFHFHPINDGTCSVKATIYIKHIPLSNHFCDTKINILKKQKQKQNKNKQTKNKQKQKQNKAVLEPRVSPVFAITYFCNHCNIRFENTSKYVDTLTLFSKNLNQRSLTPRWPLTPCLLRSHVWLYPRIIVSKSQSSMYVDTVINFAKYHIHTHTYILHTTYRMSDHIVSYWTQFRRDNYWTQFRRDKNRW